MYIHVYIYIWMYVCVMCTVYIYIYIHINITLTCVFLQMNICYHETGLNDINVLQKIIMFHVKMSSYRSIF